MQHKWLRKFYLLLILCPLLIACEREQDQDRQQVLQLDKCLGFSETGKPPIVNRAQCGSLSVPENPEATDGKKISLHILRLPAVNPAPKEDPLFIIAGGPGQSAVSIAERLFQTFEDVRKSRDIIFVDQRGTGQSHPLQCEGLTAIGHKLTFTEQKAAIRAALQECVAEHGEISRFYTTPYAVQDLDAVRRALGYQKINLWGVSYGTRVALAYMRRYPQAVRTSILDGVAPTSMALPWSAEADAQAALEKIHQQCIEREECRQRYGDLLSQANAIADRLQHAPAVVNIEHPSTRLPYQVEMNHELFASAIRMALYSRDLARILPLAIREAHGEDYRLLTALVSLAEKRSGLTDISMGMHFIVLCNEDYPQFQGRDYRESEKFLHLRAVQTASEACALWPRFPPSEDYFQPVVSDVPTLLLSGARDPVTPPYWAEQVLPGLSRGRHAVAPGGHHSITRDGCTSRLIAQFIHTGNIEQLDTHCVEKILPLLPYYELDMNAFEALQEEAKDSSEGAE